MNIGECLKNGELIETPFEEPFEEEKREDLDQAEDNVNFGKDNYLCTSIEENTKEGKRIVTDKIPEQTKFKFFLDGSLRTKYLGEFLEGGTNFSILISEVCSTVVKREKCKIDLSSLKKNIYFIFPHKDSGFIVDTTFEKLEKLQEDLERKNDIFQIKFLEKSEVKKDLRYSMQGKARDLMHSLEHEVAEKIKREEDDWLIMDGAIRKSEFLKLKSTIGLAKSFSRMPLFILPNNRKPMTITSYLKNIREGERSVVFKKQSDVSKHEKVAFWYIRLRTYPPMEPLGGLVKIDICLKEDKIDSEFVDALSSEIYFLRYPSVYPHYRWPSYIYPIRIAEIYMSSLFTNIQLLGICGKVIKNVIRKK